MKRISCENFDAVESLIDTQYFGIPSAKVLLKKPCSSLQQQAELLDFMSAFEFNVVINQLNDPINNHWLGKKTLAFLADVNVQLVKKVSLLEGITDGSTVVVDNFPGDEQIIQIAKSSFTISRFLNDPYLPVELARHIYADITGNAFGRTGRFFVIHRTRQFISGFLLFSMTHLSSTIELLATNQNFKGQGIGKSLLKSLEHYVSSLGIENIQVGTQLANTTALNFYISYGFKIKDLNSIYHYWPSKS